MKYSIGINQKAIINSNLGLDLVDACLLDYMKDFSSNPRIEKIIKEDVVYYWFSYGNIVKQLPLLGLNTKDAVYKRFKKLSEKGLLVLYPESSKLSRSYYAFTEVFFSMFFDNGKHAYPSDDDPTPSDGKHDPPHAHDPTPPHALRPRDNNNIYSLIIRYKNNGEIFSIDERSKEVFNSFKNFFLEFYKEKTLEDYYFQAKDAGKVKAILKKIIFKMKSKTGEQLFSEESIDHASKVFLRAAYEVCDGWLKSNFSLSNIDSKFNELFIQITRRQNGQQTTINKQSSYDTAAASYRS